MPVGVVNKSLIKTASIRPMYQSYYFDDTLAASAEGIKEFIILRISADYS